MVANAAGSISINVGLVCAEPISSRSVSLALFSIIDSASGISGFTRFGRRGAIVVEIVGPALTR